MRILWNNFDYQQLFISSRRSQFYFWNTNYNQAHIISLHWLSENKCYKIKKLKYTRSIQCQIIAKFVDNVQINRTNCIPQTTYYINEKTLIVLLKYLLYIISVTSNNGFLELYSKRRKTPKTEISFVSRESLITYVYSKLFWYQTKSPFQKIVILLNK